MQAGFPNPDADSQCMLVLLSLHEMGLSRNADVRLSNHMWF